MPTTHAFYLDQRRPLKDGRFPLKLEVYDGTAQRYYRATLSNRKAAFTISEWKRIQSNRRDPELQAIRVELSALLEKARTIIESLPHFNHAEFKQRWERPLSDRTNIFTWFELAAKGKSDSTREIYRNAAKSFRAYAGKDRVHFQEVKPVWLDRYERWIAEQGKSQTTASIYLRALRSVFNNAIEARAIDRDLYPFGRRSFTVPEAANPKRALSRIELDAVFDFRGDDPYGLEMWARDIFIFSLLFNGLGPADIFRLRWENVDNWQTVVDRQKTKGRRRKTAKPIHVYISEPARIIMKKWSGTDRAGYVFPCLSDSMSETDKRQAIKNETRRINRQLDKILPGLSMMAARHTFGEMLSSAGVDVIRIQRAFGHGDIRTTENYLGAFVDEEAREISEMVAERLGGRAPSE